MNPPVTDNITPTKQSKEIQYILLSEKIQNVSMAWIKQVSTWLQNTRLTSRARNAWVVTEWPLYICINYSPGNTNRMTEENPEFKMFPTSLIFAVQNPFKFKNMYGRFVEFGRVFQMIFWTSVPKWCWYWGPPFRDRESLRIKQPQANAMKTEIVT